MIVIISVVYTSFCASRLYEIEAPGLSLAYFSVAAVLLTRRHDCQGVIKVPLSMHPPITSYRHVAVQFDGPQIHRADCGRIHSRMLYTSGTEYLVSATQRRQRAERPPGISSGILSKISCFVAAVFLRPNCT